MGEGTNAPTSGGYVYQVRARVYSAKGTGGLPSAAIYTNGLGQLLGTATNSSLSPAWGSYTTLDALNHAGIKFNDLQTTQSSLEDIFVGLVGERR